MFRVVTRSWTQVPAIVACIALAGILPTAVYAGSPPPANDSFSNARVINPSALPYADTVASGAPSVEVNEPSTPCQASNNGSQWWRFSPTTNGTYRVDTMGSTFNTLLDVYRGTSLSALTAIECNDDIDSNNPDLLVSRVAFKAVAGQVYYVRVAVAAGFGTAITLHMTKVTPPANDSFANATTIKSLPFDTNAANTNATSQPTEPRPSGLFSPWCGHQRATRWYRYTPTVDQVVWANTLVASDFDTVLGVYTGSSVGTATLVACNDDQWASGGMTDSSGVTFRAKAGVTYRFQVGGFDAESGEMAELPFHVRAVSVEPNDDLANASTFTSLPYSDGFSLRRATRQAGETSPCNEGMVNSVWYRYDAAINASVAISAEVPETFLYSVGVYEMTGPGFAGLTFLACGNGVGTAVQAGHSYAVQVTASYAIAPVGKLLIEFD